MPGWLGQKTSPSGSTTTSNKSSPRRDNIQGSPHRYNSKSSPRRCSNKTGNREGRPPSKAGSPDKPSPPPKPARDSPASPPPAKGEKERKEEPVEIPAERKDKALSPKKKSPKKTTTAEIMKEELEAVKRKAQGSWIIHRRTWEEESRREPRDREEAGMLHLPPLHQEHLPTIPLDPCLHFLLAHQHMSQLLFPTRQRFEAFS